MAIRTEVLRRIEDVSPDVWNRAYPSTVTGYYFLKTLDESRFEQFSFRYIVVYEDNVPVGAAPCFLVNYSLDTTVQGWLRRLTNRVKKFFPNIFSAKALACGLPMDPGRIGIVGEPARVIEAICVCLEKIADDEKASIIAFKDFDSTYAKVLEPLLGKGFSRFNNLPTTEMDICSTSFDEYLRTLSSSSREGLKRKFKKVDGHATIDLGISSELQDDVLSEVYRLYLQTVERHEMGFEVAPMDFFKNISKNMPKEVKYFLWRIDGKLVAFALCMVSGDFFSDYYLGFDYSVAYKYHLYFVRFRDLMNWCIENNMRKYNFGITNYEAKRRFGFNFVPLYLYVKHRNSLLNPLFRILCHFLKPENFDPVLKKAKR